jgi:hypothetical protein
VLNTANYVSIRRQVEDFPKVKSFLESISRNSKKSKESYHSGIKHFQEFLAVKYSNNTVESILLSLNRQEMSVYERNAKRLYK